MKIVSNMREPLAELSRLERMPTVRAREALDAVLSTGFVKAQADVHVQTGSLKSSGKKSSEVRKVEAEWEGTLSWGGDSTGVNNPVDYAIYEKARGVGGAGGASDAKGDHDFTRSLSGLRPAYVAAMKKGMGR